MVFLSIKKRNKMKQESIQENSQPAAFLTVGSKNRSTRTQILKRRKEMINNDRLGLQPKEWIPQVAAKYGATEEAVKRDWSNRKKWMKTYLSVKDTKSRISALMLEYDITYEEVCLLCEQEKNSKAKMQFLYLKLKIIEKKNELMKQLGYYELLRKEFRIEALKHSRKLEEEWFPWMKGNIEAANKNLKDFKKKTDFIATDILPMESLFLEILAYRDA
jgi:hypothetical protein